MAALAAAHPEARGLTRRLLDQALRELLLAQASDWPFILTNRTSVTYALRRFEAHVTRFLRLDAMLSGAAAPDEAWVRDVEARDALFPELDYRLFTPS